MEQRIKKSFLSSVPAVVLAALLGNAITVVQWSYKGTDYDARALVPSLVFVVGGMLFLPWAYGKIILKRDMKEFGWRMPTSWRRALVWVGVATAVFLPVAVIFAGMEPFQKYYSVANMTVPRFLLFGVVVSAVYYPAEEFILRGFLFKEMWRRIGWHSFWVVAVVSTVFHITKPTAEIFFAPFLSIALSFLTLKTRSFVPAAIVHYVLALVFNVLIHFVWGMPGGHNTFRF